MRTRVKKNQIQAPNVFIPGRDKLLEFWGDFVDGNSDDGDELTWCSCCSARGVPVAYVGLQEKICVGICGKCIDRLKSELTQREPVLRVIPTRRRST